MPRYCKQRDNYSCAPIAILNALKWTGKNKTLKDLSKLKKELQTTKQDGTYFVPEQKVVQKYFKSTYFRDLDFKTFKKYLLQNKAIIFRYTFFSKTGEHFAHSNFVSGIKDDKYIVAHNFFADKSTSLLTKKQMQFWLNRCIHFHVIERD
jgi:hypothetical protein